MKHRETYKPLRSAAYYQFRTFARFAVKVIGAMVFVWIAQLFFVMLWALGGN